MTQHPADNFPSIELERKKEAALNRPSRAKPLRELDEARERAKRVPPGPARDALLKEVLAKERE